MRSCYPLFPTGVWSMIFQIFLENARENADTLATPLEKAQTQFIHKITTEYCIIVIISYNIQVVISTSHLVVLFFYKWRYFFSFCSWIAQALPSNVFNSLLTFLPDTILAINCFCMSREFQHFSLRSRLKHQMDGKYY